jgi:hypothetical protein
MDQAAASLTNLPQGYKIALTEFQNMNTGSNPYSNPNNENYGGGGGLGATPNTASPGPGYIWVPGEGWVNVGGSPTTGTGSASGAVNDVSGNSGSAGATGPAGFWEGNSSNPTAPPTWVPGQSPPAGSLQEPGVVGGQSVIIYFPPAGSGHNQNFVRKNGAGSSSSGSSASGSGSSSSGLTIIIQSMQITASNAQDLFAQIQRMATTKAMAKYGRRLSTTRFSLPTDGR